MVALARSKLPAFALKRTGGSMSIGWQVCILLLLLISAAAFGQQTAPVPSASQGGPGTIGSQRGAHSINVEATAVKSGHQYVVAIGIDHYENWPVLSTAVSDATGFAKLLTDKFGFEYAVEPLTEKSATRDAIRSLIDDDLRSRLKP